MNHRTESVVTHLSLTFGVAWTLREFPLRFGLSPHDPPFQPVVLLGGFALATAAIIVRKWTTQEDFKMPDWA